MAVRIIPAEFPWKVEIDGIDDILSISIREWLDDNVKGDDWLGYECSRYRSGAKPIKDKANDLYGIFFRNEADALLMKLRFS